MPIPTQSAAHAALARLYKSDHSLADLAAAKEVMASARLKRLILKVLSEGEPITPAHRQELADLILAGGESR